MTVTRLPVPIFNLHLRPLVSTINLLSAVNMIRILDRGREGVVGMNMMSAIVCKR